MKKNLIFVAMATMTLASCVQEESLETKDVLSSVPKEITFQTVVAKQSSRALVNGSEYKPEHPEFGAWARYNPNGNTVGTMAFIENDKIEYLTEGNVGYWGINAEEGHDVHYWPASGSLTFFAYSPYYFQELAHASQTVASSSYSAPQAGQHGVYFPNYDVDIHQETDLMVADVMVGQTANITQGESNNASSYTGVPTIFRHKLAVVLAFNLSTSDDYDGNFAPGDEATGPWNTGAENGDMRFYVQSIKLKNIKSNGTYKGETYMADGTKINDEWIAPTEQQKEYSYTWFENDNGVEFGYGLAKTLQLSYIAQDTPIHKNPTIKNTTTQSDDYKWYLLVLPQDFEEGKQQLEVTYFIKTYSEPTNPPTSYAAAEACWTTNGTTITKTIDLIDVHPEGKKAWKMNQKVIYNLKFSTSEIRWAPQIVQWENAFEGGYTVDF